MQDRETALREALRRTISLMEHYWPRPNDEQAEAMNRAYRVLASPLSAPPQEPTQSGNVRALTVHICEDCLNLRGEMCNEPCCRFCRRTMAEVAEYLDVLLIRPRIDGVSVLVDEGTPLPPVSPQEPTGASPQADVTCEHGTAMDVHCCNCHSGFIFDVNHECPAPELTWREAVEQALGVENDPENHTPSWAFDVVRAAREIGNAPTPASPQAETPIQTLCKNCMQSERFIAPDGSTICHYCGFVQPAPVSPVEPAGSPTTAHVAPIVGKVWTHHDGVLPDGSVCRTADVDALIAGRTAQLQAALFDEQASHEATKCRLVAAEQSHEAAGNRVIELLKSTPVEPAGAAPEGREHPMTERAKKVATLEITLRARYDVQTGRMVGLGVETPNAQGWHPRVTGSYMSTADRVFPAKLPRAAARIAKKG